MTPDQRRAHIRKIVAAAPPLSDETRAHLRALLGPQLRKHRRNTPQ